MFKGKLYPAQKSGANFLCQKETALLAYEQGTGKTVIALAAVEKLRELSLINNSVLILAPGGITWQWEERIKEFTDEDVRLVESQRRSTRKYLQDVSYTITSYGLFRNDYSEIVTKNWDIIICDEAEAFANNKSKTAKALKKFNTETSIKYKWALTGTAVSNHLEEIYSILYWVDRKFLPDWPTFEKRHIKRHPLTNSIVSYKGLSKLAPYLQKKVSRKTHNDMKGQLPELLFNTIYLEKAEEVIEAETDLLSSLDALVEEISINSSGDIRDARVSRAFHKARFALCKSKSSCAIELIEKILNENDTNRIVLFSFYKELIRDLQAELTLDGIITSTFTGDENSKQKQDSIKKFRDYQGVLLCSNAGARGLDLPFANYVIHLDIPFSYGTLDQRNKRIVRASSLSATCVVNYLLVKNSCEEYFFSQVKNKEKLAKSTYSGEEDLVVIKPTTLRKYLENENIKREAKAKD